MVGILESHKITMNILKFIKENNVESMYSIKEKLGSTLNTIKVHLKFLESIGAIKIIKNNHKKVFKYNIKITSLGNQVLNNFKL